VSARRRPWRRALPLLVALLGGAASAGGGPNAAPPPPAAGAVEARTFWSQALGARKQYVVYLPPSYGREPARRYPVAYYLHGRGGGEWDWVRSGRINLVLDSLAAAGRPEMIVVMPDGDDGWYTTWNWLGDYAACRRAPPRDDAASYCVPWLHYDDYVARDLVAHVDSTLRTRAGRAHRGVAGLSMGGYGAVSLALAYPDVFGAAASHSGVLSPMRVGWDSAAGAPRYASDVAQLRGGARVWFPELPHAFGKDTAGWWARDPARLAARAARRGGGTAPPLPALFADVGRADPWVDDSRAFRAEMRRLGVPLRYAEWEGAHDWAYWRRHVRESLAFLQGEVGGE
jgi:putative tributyrin esterase